jgi:hypothetical protein
VSAERHGHSSARPSISAVPHAQQLDQTPQSRQSQPWNAMLVGYPTSFPTNMIQIQNSSFNGFSFQYPRSNLGADRMWYQLNCKYTNSVTEYLNQSHAQVQVVSLSLQEATFESCAPFYVLRCAFFHYVPELLYSIWPINLPSSLLNTELTKRQSPGKVWEVQSQSLELFRATRGIPEEQSSLL